MILITYVISK